MQPSLILLPGGLGLVLGAVLPLAVLPLLRRLGVLDMPGERSSHAVPTLRGMGLATAAAALLGVAVDPDAAGQRLLITTRKGWKPARD